MADKLELMIEKLKSTFGENLVSAVLYGSKASGEDTGKNSDYNVLIILNDARYEQLKKLSVVTSSWIKSGNPPPFVFDMEMFKNSADVFPMEFLDMKDHHKVLFGEDPFDKIEIEKTNLRHQCEFELKGKFLGLRRNFLLSQSKPDKIRDILIGSLSTILIIFSQILRLTGKVPPGKKIDAALELSDLAGFSPEVFITVLKMKQGEKPVGKGDMEKLMADYLDQIEKAVSFIDSHEKNGGVL